MLTSTLPTRRERTFVGSACATCEEPLEHILRGEAILQLTCGHISHEACLYEYVREGQAAVCPTCEAPLDFDTSRGGKVDYDSLRNLVRAAQDTIDQRKFLRQDQGPSATSSVHNASENMTEILPEVSEQQSLNQPVGNSPLISSDEDATPSQIGTHLHSRNVSSIASQSSRERQKQYAASHDEPEMPVVELPSGVQNVAKYPIPEPTIVMRSEFPSITKSRYQQSLTCMVTVEVPESNWSALSDSNLISPSIQAPHDHLSIQPSPMPDLPKPMPVIQDSVEDLEAARKELFDRVDDWHGLDPKSFGKLQLRGSAIKVGKDRKLWQELDCYLFSEMLICVKEKKASANACNVWDGLEQSAPTTRWVLKGSILIKKHLEEVAAVPDHDILTLGLSVPQLPAFHLLFASRTELEVWSRALNSIDWDARFSLSKLDLDEIISEMENEATKHHAETPQQTTANSPIEGIPNPLRPSVHHVPATAENVRHAMRSHHVPMDVVIVVPLSSTAHGFKADIIRSSLRFLISQLGDMDRLALVTVGEDSGSKILAPLATRYSAGWSSKIDLIQPLARDDAVPDVIEGANAAIDALMRRRSSNFLAQILLLSDTAVAPDTNIDLLASRAATANIGIYTFGLGMTHTPDALIKISSQTKASYTYVKEWSMLRDCLAGCFGSLQSISHQNVKLRLRLPDGSSAKFVKVSGALEQAKNVPGRSIEVALGDLRYGDRRNVLVQLIIQPERITEAVLADHFESMVSTLPGMSPIEPPESRSAPAEEVPLLEADLDWGDVLSNGNRLQLPQYSNLTITRLPSAPFQEFHLPSRPKTPITPPHPYIVQRRLELLTSDMLMRALALVDQDQSARATHLLSETRTILQELGKANLSSLPTPPPSGALPPTPRTPEKNSPLLAPLSTPSSPNRGFSSRPSSSSRTQESTSLGNVSFDPAMMAILDAELNSNLEWIAHPDIFARDPRKAILQAIGVISTQRGFTLRTPAEAFYAARISSVQHALEQSRAWQK
jgi:hypothetical protein